MNSKFAITLATAALSFASLSEAVTLADLTDSYDVVVEGTAALNNAHIHGSLAAGHADMTNSIINSQGGAHDATYSLVAKTVNLSGWTQVQNNDGQGQARIETILPGQYWDVPNGNQIMLKQPGGALDLSNAGNTVLSVGQSSGVDFVGAFTGLRGLSSTIAGMAADLSLSALSTSADNSVSGALRVINTTWSDLYAAGDLFFNNLAAGAKVIINVDLSGGATPTLNGNHNGDNLKSDQVLWNFFGSDGELVQLGDKQWYGSILATDNTIKHVNSNMLGRVYAEGLEKSGQLHIHGFDYDFEVPVPDSGSTLLLAFLGLSSLVWIRRRAA